MCKAKDNPSREKKEPVRFHGFFLVETSFGVRLPMRDILVRIFYRLYEDTLVTCAHELENG